MQIGENQTSDGTEVEVLEATMLGTPGADDPKSLCCESKGNLENFDDKVRSTISSSPLKTLIEVASM